MSWRDDLSNFDLTRLTPVGWLGFLVSIGVGFLIGLVVQLTWNSIFPPQPGAILLRRIAVGGVAFFGAALGVFFAAKAILNLANVKTVRPRVRPAQAARLGVAKLRKRVYRAKVWWWIFVLMMPFGCVTPCSLAFALAPRDGAVPEGITLPQILAMLSLILPFVGLIGWQVARSNVIAQTEALEIAEEHRKQRED